MDTSRSQHRRSTQHDLAIRSHVPREPDGLKRAVAAKTGIECTHSFLLDLAYEEYCELCKKNGAVDKSLFAGRFPDIRHSLIRRIEVHEFLEDVDFDFAETDLQQIEYGDILFSSFRVIEKLGHGALGHVFLCEQLGVGDRQTVVKVAFQGAYEAETQGKLSHPNIMPVYSVHEEEVTRRSGICMPFHGRSTLCDVLDLAWKDEEVTRDSELVGQAAIRWTQDSDRVESSIALDILDWDYVDSVVRVGIELASALEHSHLRGVRHDDLKPSNILVGVGGQTKLLDFNLSSHEGTPGQCGGTLPYMSPEQIRRIHSTRAKIDNRSDIFSLGILLYELLAGQRPYLDPANSPNRKQAGKRLDVLRSEKVAPISSHNHEVDRELDQLVRRCFEFHPDDRYRDVSSVLEALSSYRAERRTRLQAIQDRSKQALKWLAGLVVVGVGLMLCAAGINYLLGGRANHRSIQKDTAETTNSWSHLGPGFSEAGTLVAKENYREAVRILEPLLDQNPKAAHACLGYVALKGSAERNISSEHCKVAIDLGLENAANWNNYALSYLAPMRRKGEELRREKAKEWRTKQLAWDRAVELEPNALTVRHNRATFELRRINSFKIGTDGAIPFVAMCFPYQALEDIRLVRRGFPDNGRVARVAAEILSWFARCNASYRQEMFDALIAARKTGYLEGYRDGNGYSYLRWLSDDFEFQELLKIDAETGASFDSFETAMDPFTNRTTDRNEQEY